MEDLESIIKRYFPLHIYPSDLNYSYTEEILEQELLLEAKRNEKNSFQELSNFLFKNLNSEYKVDLSLRGVFDLSRKTLFKMPDNHHHQEYPYCLISVSIVIPYFDIYFTKYKSIPINTITSGNTTKGQDFLKKHIATIISSYFVGYKLIPAVFSTTVIPEIFSSKNYNNFATYYECLMTDTLW